MMRKRLFEIIEVANDDDKMSRALRLLRTLRIFRVFKVICYSKSISIIINVFKRQEESLIEVCLNGQAS